MDPLPNVNAHNKRKDWCFDDKCENIKTDVLDGVRLKAKKTTLSELEAVSKNLKYSVVEVAYKIIEGGIAEYIEKMKMFEKDAYYAHSVKCACQNFTQLANGGLVTEIQDILRAKLPKQEPTPAIVSTSASALAPAKTQDQQASPPKLPQRLDSFRNFLKI